MYHRLALLLLIVSVHPGDSVTQPRGVFVSSTRDTERLMPAYTHKFSEDPRDITSVTSNVFNVGADTQDKTTVAHALGDKGVKAHLKALQGEVRKEWQHNFVLDYSLLNYKRSVAEMTRKCIKMMETLRDEMSYDTASLVNKEVDRVWPTLEVLNEMKAYSDKDRRDGYMGAWTEEPSDEMGKKKKIEQSFMLADYYPKKAFYRNFLENVLHRADHAVVSRMGQEDNMAAHESNPTRMLNGEARPRHGVLASGKAEASAQYSNRYNSNTKRTESNAMNTLKNGSEKVLSKSVHDDNEVRNSLPDRNKVEQPVAPEPVAPELPRKKSVDMFGS